MQHVLRNVQRSILEGTICLFRYVYFVDFLKICEFINTPSFLIMNRIFINISLDDISTFDTTFDSSHDGWCSLSLRLISEIWYSSVTREGHLKPWIMDSCFSFSGSSHSLHKSFSPQKSCSFRSPFLYSANVIVYLLYLFVYIVPYNLNHKLTLLTTRFTCGLNRLWSESGHPSLAHSLLVTFLLNKTCISFFNDIVLIMSLT